MTLQLIPDNSFLKFFGDVNRGNRRGVLILLQQKDRKKIVNEGHDSRLECNTANTKVHSELTRRPEFLIHSSHEGRLRNKYRYWYNQQGFREVCQRAVTTRSNKMKCLIFCILSRHSRTDIT